MRFRPGFTPERIYGTQPQLQELGITVADAPSNTSWFWTHENPREVVIPDREYEAELIGLEDGCGDVFFSNGVIFGYVDEEDILECTNSPS